HTISAKGRYNRPIILSADGKRIALAQSPEFKPDVPHRPIIQILDASAGKAVKTWDRDASDTHEIGLALSSDGKLLASMGSQGVLRLHEVASGAELLTQRFPGDIMAHLAFSPNGATLAVGCVPTPGRRLFGIGRRAQSHARWRLSAGRSHSPFPRMG